MIADIRPMMAMMVEGRCLVQCRVVFKPVKTEWHVPELEVDEGEKMMDVLRGHVRKIEARKMLRSIEDASIGEMLSSRKDTVSKAAKIQALMVKKSEYKRQSLVSCLYIKEKQHKQNTRLTLAKVNFMLSFTQSITEILSQRQALEGKLIISKNPLLNQIALDLPQHHSSLSHPDNSNPPLSALDLYFKLCHPDNSLLSAPISRFRAYSRPQHNRLLSKSIFAWQTIDLGQHRPHTHTHTHICSSVLDDLLACVDVRMCGQRACVEGGLLMAMSVMDGSGYRDAHVDDVYRDRGVEHEYGGKDIDGGYRERKVVKRFNEREIGVKVTMDNCGEIERNNAHTVMTQGWAGDHHCKISEVDIECEVDSIIQLKEQNLVEQYKQEKEDSLIGLSEGNWTLKEYGKSYNTPSKAKDENQLEPTVRKHTTVINRGSQNHTVAPSWIFNRPKPDKVSGRLVSSQNVQKSSHIFANKNNPSLLSRLTQIPGRETQIQKTSKRLSKNISRYMRDIPKQSGRPVCFANLKHLTKYSGLAQQLRSQFVLLQSRQLEALDLQIVTSDMSTSIFIADVSSACNQELAIDWLIKSRCLSFTHNYMLVLYMQGNKLDMLNQFMAMLYSFMSTLEINDAPRFDVKYYTLIRDMTEFVSDCLTGSSGKCECQELDNMLKCVIKQC